MKFKSKMAKVEIYKLNNNGDQVVIATCVLDTDGEVVCNGQQTLIKNLQEEGIIDYSARDRSMLYPKDGKKFLEQLKFNFKSAYLSASKVING